MQQAAQEGVLEGAVDDALRQPCSLGVILVVVDLIEVAHGGGPQDQAPGVAVLPYRGYLLSHLYILKIDLTHSPSPSYLGMAGGQPSSLH